MALTKLDLMTAEKTIRIKNSNYCLSFVTLVWKGEVVMCCYNNISKEIANVFTSQNMYPDEYSDLEQLIGDYIFGSAAEAIL